MRTFNQTCRSAVRVGVALTLLTLAVSTCDKMPLTAPSGTALTLIPGGRVLPVNGQMSITALLIEGGQQGGTGGGVTAGTGTPVHNGTVVSFITTLGRIDPVEVKTTNGYATVRLLGDGRSGTATITAFSGPARASVDVSVGAAAAVFIVATAEPQALPSGGGASKITARVEDQEGNGLGGVPVSFSTTRGTLALTTIVTNANGEASTTLSTSQDATVTVTTGGASATLTATVAVTVSN
jgi:hypothetical protein